MYRAGLCKEMECVCSAGPELRMPYLSSKNGKEQQLGMPCAFQHSKFQSDANETQRIPQKSNVEGFCDQTYVMTRILKSDVNLIHAF